MSAIADSGALRVQPAEPLFEDAFIARLKRVGAHAAMPSAARRCT